MSDAPVSGLTAREQEVLGLLREGRANKDIAETLGCSVRTVEFHISNLLRKVGVSSRLELVARGKSTLTLTALATEQGPFVEVRLFSGVASAALGDTVVALWTAPATVERWAWHWARVEELLQGQQGGVICLSLVLSSSSPPDAELRSRMKADVERIGVGLRRFVVVPLGDSMWAAIVRTIGQTVMLLSGQSERQRVVASVDQALSQVLSARGPDTPSRDELERVLGELSRLLGVPKVGTFRAQAG